MPRIARPPTIESERARSEIKAYVSKTGVSVNLLAGRVGIGQPLLCRFLSGRTKNLSEKSRRVLDYVHNESNTCISDRAQNMDNADLHEVLNAVCGQNRDATRLLAQLIQAIGPILLERLGGKSSTRQPQ